MDEPPRPAPPLPAASECEVAGTHLTLVVDGSDRLARYCALIDSATRDLTLITYTFMDDAAGRRVRDALIAACTRGISVRLVIDSFGSGTTPAEFFQPLTDAGANLHWFSGRWSTRYLIRNHQKLLVADRTRACIGGFNIADDYFAAPDEPESWRDIGVFMDGPFAEVCARWADALFGWAARESGRWRHLSRLVRRFAGDDEAMALLIGGPTPRLSPWNAEFRRALADARDLWLTVAYFSPNAGLLRRLARVSRRGGSVQLVLPSTSDNPATVGASRLLYGYLLKRGVAIAEFERSPLHNKLVVADDTVFIGSSNLDMRSLYLNVELMMRVTDAGFAEQCRRVIAAQRDGESTVITPALHASRRTTLNWLRWAASWFVVTVVDYGVTRRLNFGLPPRD